MSTLWEPNGTRNISHSTNSYDAKNLRNQNREKKNFVPQERHKGARTSSRSKRFAKTMKARVHDH